MCVMCVVQQSQKWHVQSPHRLELDLQHNWCTVVHLDCGGFGSRQGHHYLYTSICIIGDLL